MPLRFSSLCTLLSDLESYANHDPPFVKSRLEEKSTKRITNWFASYRISSASTDVDLAALLSAFFPDRRKDRVYGLKSCKLARSLRRILHLGCGRWPLLDEWNKPGRGDLADCVERVLLQAEFPKYPIHQEVTLEDVDAVLAAVAQKCRFSSPQIRAAPEDARNVNELLGSVYRRLQSNEAKWLTRMILTEYPPLLLPESMVFELIDRRLPESMRVHDNFDAALEAIKGADETVHGSARGQGVRGLMISRPKTGVKVGRPRFLKARSIKNAFQLARYREMCLERKYDGEYCQIHVDLSKGDRWIQIFSKSGKDSTRDRHNLHENIRETLRIGLDDCQILRNCILEGEMVVWDDKDRRVLEFCKIRKHVSRSGSFLGNKKDSQAHSHEHLMIFFYDVLMIDDEPVLDRPLLERRIHMERIVQPIAGRVELAENRTLDFSKAGAADRLREYLAEAFVKRWEGLVMKPAGDSYFGSGLSAAWIKLKKDYIPGLGDTADFAVVGAAYDQASAARYGLRDLRWTHFYLGCLFNPEEVAYGGKPHFAVVDTVSWDMRPDDLRTVNQLGAFSAIEADSSEARDLFRFHVIPGLLKMAVVFKKPFVFEVMGGGFDKPSNSEWYTPRWPRVLKVHQDRVWKDAVSLEQLQHMALEARKVPETGIREEIEEWSKKLDRVDRRSQSVMLPWDNTQENHEQSSKLIVLPKPLPSAVSEISRCVREDFKRNSRNDQNDQIARKDKKDQNDQDCKRHRRSEQAIGEVIFRRSKLTAVPMIRMDSNEMLPGERRTNNGEVTMRYPSHGTNNSLPTPPPSSPQNPSPRDRKQAWDHQGVEQTREAWTVDKAVALQMRSSPSDRPKAAYSGHLKRRASMTGLASNRKKRMASREPTSDEEEDAMLAHAIWKANTHIEDRRSELSRREMAAKSMQTPLHERTDNTTAPPRRRLSFYADPLPHEQVTALPVPKITTGAPEKQDRTAQPVLHLSSPGYQTAVEEQTTPEMDEPKTQTLKSSADNDTKSLPSVISETPQPFGSTQVPVKMASANLEVADFDNWGVIFGYTVSPDAKARIRNQLHSRSIPYMNLPVSSGLIPQIGIILPSILTARDLILLVDSRARNASSMTEVATDEEITFIHCLDQRPWMKGSVWDIQCLHGVSSTLKLDTNCFLGDVAIQKTKHATVTGKDGNVIHREWDSLMNKSSGA